MRGLDDLITDIASIVTACRPGELMTVKKVEEGYREIKNGSIPYYDYGYSSVEKLLESFPNHFQFSSADGILIIRTNTKSNITELISKEKSKQRTSSSSSNFLYKKHRRKEIHVTAELPIVTRKNIIDMLKKYEKPMRKEDFLRNFETICGYPLKYLDYGFIDLEHLLRELDCKVLDFRKNMIFPLNKSDGSIYDYLIEVLSKNTGFSVSAMQEYISNISPQKICDLMKSEGFVNFIDVIYDANKKKFLSYDFDLIYPYTDRIALPNPFYPTGICEIKFLNVNSPSDFHFSITSTHHRTQLDFIDSLMRQMSSKMELLSMFKQHKICAVEYDSMWFRAKIVGLSCEKNFESLSLRFIDHPIEVETGIEISLPTDRLRFLPSELEVIPGFIHKGSLAYVKPIEGMYKWNKESCERFSSLVKDPDRTYHSYLVAQNEHGVSIDVVAVNNNSNNNTGDENDDDDNDNDGEKVNIFHELIREKFARINWA